MGAGEVKMRIGEIGKELGKKWSEMGAESKSTWEEKARGLKADYDEAMKSYTPSEEFLREKAAHQEAMKNKRNKRHYSPSEVQSYFDFVSNTRWSQWERSCSSASSTSSY